MSHNPAASSTASTELPEVQVTIAHEHSFSHRPSLVAERKSELQGDSGPSALAAAAGDAGVPPVKKSMSYTHSERKKQDADLTKAYGGVTPLQRFERFVQTRFVWQLGAGLLTPVQRQPTPTPTYYCQICMCHNEMSEAVELPCKHLFCKDCMLGFCQSKVNEAILDFTCPFVDDEPQAASSGAADCTQPIDEAFMRDVLKAPADTLEKAARFRAQQDKNFRECPQCNAPNTQGVGPWMLRGKKLTCGQCAHVFCFTHGDAHPGRSCAAYEKAQRQSELATQARQLIAI